MSLVEQQTSQGLPVNLYKREILESLMHHCTYGLGSWGWIYPIDQHFLFYNFEALVLPLLLFSQSDEQFSLGGSEINLLVSPPRPPARCLLLCPYCAS